MVRNILDAFAVEALHSNRISRFPLNIRRYNHHMLRSSFAINFICSTKKRWHQSERKKVAAARAHVDHIPAYTAVAVGVAAENEKQQPAMPLELAAGSGDVAVDAASENAKRQPALPLELIALVTVKRKSENKLNTMKDMMLRLLGNYASPNGQGDHHNHKGVVLQLVSTQIHTKEMKPKLSEEAILHWKETLKMGAGKCITYQVKFVVDSNFGMPGAITVSNRYNSEFYLDSINIEGVVHFACNSWVQSEHANPAKRIFFSTKAYLPSETPAGIKELREMELIQLRGDGTGLRKPSDRIYDYDTYSNIGNPNKGIEYIRPILGGSNHPYPRHCRTGGPPTKTDEKLESPVNEFSTLYVPRDEEFEESKREAFDLGRLKAIMRHIIPALTKVARDSDEFKAYSDITGLYRDGMPSITKNMRNLPLPNILNKVQEYLKFDPTKLNSRFTACGLPDDEFGRQAIAGINPLSIERLTTFPPVSKLNASTYGPQESALKEEHIQGHLNGMSVQQALEENKLFILDYHDIFLPFINQINAMDDRKAYATRTLFFLTSLGTLKPIAIELSLHQTNSDSPSKQVLTPPVDATTNWLWELGKAHVCSNDSCVHQLIHHWLRSHACMETFIIATHRQLSAMHPIYRLLKPHMRYTMKINALARQFLINSEGIIESTFTAGKHSMEISCAAYRDWWRFDLEGLPADLIRRGIATPDPSQVHGLRLLIEDYPYATDGLLIWAAIERLVQTYVHYYYPDTAAVDSDTELQAWYKEWINSGHADLRHASWWPQLSTPDDLASILTTIIWLSSAYHAALNYGQYPYGGYVPTRPPHMRRLLPQEHELEYATFIEDPEKYFLSSLPSLLEATKYMAVTDIISAHSPDEEYIGERKDLSTWSADPVIIEAFYRFSMDTKRIEKEIAQRNSNSSLRNRCGAGVSPYELLMSSSEPGVTARGIPNSISV
ncbi:putative linoleate 13S-lipoxygenase [Rosa chinensis]|uniref:Lipoxygenase n=2 Tax=Rosa chinensis TaxID=74649 RepID=A0A2P6Q441_ROSCH|nr:putative linoleate 13S-lipoxygenase [Rosa chinensis]